MYDSEYKKAYHAKNKEWISLEQKKRYRREKERRLLKEKERYQRNKGKIIARMKEKGSTYKADPIKKKARQQRKNKAKKARRRNAFVEPVENYIVFELSEGICGICNEPILENFHLDHIVPLSRGGLHCYENAQAAHPSCNIKKGNKLEGGLEGSLGPQAEMPVV